MSRVSLGFIPPQLPSLTDQPPDGGNWIHEIKHDGFRTIIVVERRGVRAFTRNGHDWSDRIPASSRRPKACPVERPFLTARSSCRTRAALRISRPLQSALRRRDAPLIFYAFDLLHVDGKDVRREPLLERRARLKKLVEPDPMSVLQFSEEFAGDGAAFFKVCAKHKLEGIVSKLATAPYSSGRSKTWLKTKCFVESELILVGIDRDRKTGAQRAILAKRNRGKLVYAGPAFIVLQRDERDAFEARLDDLANAQPAFSWLRNRKARWVRPELNVKVKHLVGGGLLRHATLRGLA